VCVELAAFRADFEQRAIGIWGGTKVVVAMGAKVGREGIAAGLYPAVNHLDDASDDENRGGGHEAVAENIHPEKDDDLGAAKATAHQRERRHECLQTELESQTLLRIK